MLPNHLQQASMLVDAAQKGNRQAFDQLVRRYRSRVFSLALHLTASTSDADDITQDVFLKAFIKMKEFEGRSAFFTWLYRITLNRSLNLERYRKKTRSFVGLEDPRIRFAIKVDAGNDPRKRMELQEAYTWLIQAFDQLSPLLRITLVLTTSQGLNYKEAAVILNTKESTVAWRVHEARMQLNAKMKALSRNPKSLRHKNTQGITEELRSLLGNFGFDSIYPVAIKG